MSPPSLNALSSPSAKLAQPDFGHAVRFYSDDFSFFDELIDFVSAVLRSGEPVIMVVTQTHAAIIRKLLANRGLDPDARSFLLLDADSLMERFMLNGEPDPMRFRDLMLRNLARARGGYGRNEQRVTIFGEMVAVLWGQGDPKAAIQLEELWNELARTQRFSLICGYPARLFEASEHWDAFADVCAAHSTLLPDETYAALQGPARETSALHSEDVRLPAMTKMPLKARPVNEESVRQEEAESIPQPRIEQLSLGIEQTPPGLRDACGEMLHPRDHQSRRIAQELHDSTAQLLSALGLYVDLLEESGEENIQTRATPAAQPLSRSNALIRQILLEVRTLACDLHPPALDRVGLGSALQWYGTRFAHHTGTFVTVEVPESLDRLPQAIEIAIFRFVQECLAQIPQHAAGARVNIRVSRSSEGAALSMTVPADCAPSAATEASLPDIFGTIPAQLQERVRLLNGRIFTVAESGSSGVSVFFPGQQHGTTTVSSVPSAS